MAINEFLPFATDAGANVISQATWAGGVLSQGQTRGQGFLGGKTALSEEANKVWRQSQFFAAMLAKFIADMGLDALDNGNLEALLANFRSSVQITAGRVRLTAPVTDYYVSPSGSDSNDGQTALTPWATLNHAWAWIRDHVDLQGLGVVINMDNGTYAQLEAEGPLVGQGSTDQVLFRGDPSTPTNVVITAFGHNACTAGFGARFRIEGVSISASGGSPYYGGGGLGATPYGMVTFDRINFGACSNFQISCAGGQVWAGSPLTGTGAIYSISGGAMGHMRAINMGATVIQNASVQITGSPGFSFAFGSVNEPAMLYCPNNTYVGGALGTRYVAQANGVILTNGAGASYLPGDSPGTTATGGQYI